MPRALQRWDPAAGNLALAWLIGAALLAVAAGAAIAVADVNAFYLAAAIVGCGFVLYDFRIGVVLLILMLPISRSAFFPHALLGVTGLNPFNVLLVGTFGSFLLRALLSPRGDGSLSRFLPPPLVFLYILPIVAAALLGMGHVREIAPIFQVTAMLEFTDAGGYLREMLLKPMLLVAYALLVAAAVARSASPERFLRPMLVSIWIMAGILLVFVALSGAGLSQLASSTSRSFLSALGLHANDLGRLYCIAYALLLFTFAEARTTGLRVALLVSMVLVVLALLLTFSRGAFVGFLVVNALYVAWRINARTMLAVLVLGAAGLAFMPEAVFQRMTTGFGGGANDVSAGRIEGLWLPLIPDVLRSPVFGSGLGSILWSEAMRKTDGSFIIGATHPHSAYLQVLLDMGIVGLALIGAYILHVWRGFRALWKDESLPPELRGFFQGACAGLASFLVGAFTDSRFTPVPEQAFLWLAIGVMYGLQARAPRERAADGAPR